MTSTIAVKSQAVAVADWVKIFPKQVTENYTGSVTFMKQLTVIAISTIAYLRNAFPEDSFTTESFVGLKLKILKQKCSDADAQFVSTGLTQAFEAFDKRYLKQIALCFYEDECKSENLVEYHMLEYWYEGEAVTLSAGVRGRSARRTFAGARADTAALLRALLVLLRSWPSALPPAYDISLRLYYNNDAPAEYQAPGYRCDARAAPLPDGALLLTSGVATPFHSVQLRTYCRDAVKASHEAIASQNPPAITQPDDDMSYDLSEEAPLRCPCRRRERWTQDEALLTCHYCGARQHAVCFGVRRARAARLARHCCAACHDAARAPRPTDRRLAALSHRDRESLCIFRHALEACARLAVVEARALAERLALSAGNAAKLMMVLRSHGVINMRRDDDPEKPQKIIVEQLQAAIDNFFQGGEEENIVDLLLAESIASQESHSDPISEVLSPLERVSLRNDSNVCRVAEPSHGTIQEDITENRTLKEYRQAILSNDKIEDLENVTEGLRKGGVQSRSVKRKGDEGSDENNLRLRSGVRSKRGRTQRK